MFIRYFLPYVDIDTICAANKTIDCYFYTEGSWDRIGIIVHLVMIFPACVLVLLQFTPAVRRRYTKLHRLNGYVIILLSALSMGGVILTLPNAIGGTLDAQVSILALLIAFLLALGLALYNAWYLQIEQHRAWMLRAWFYAGSIVTMRIVVRLLASLVSDKGYVAPLPCARISSIIGPASMGIEYFSDCAPYFRGEDDAKAMVVLASLSGNGANITATYNVVFGSAIWLGLVLHAVGIEIYLRLTPSETERLRQISYARQLNAGMKSPGRMGLTADRLGDSPPWMPPEALVVHQEAQ
ncbi:hypothetical protein VTJ83DRAFT_1450 [Remersonia thermophila]|uniref:DUF2306 domain-containing protein n=1 Tax=Remersonia thermophila TaxID=72144 RepID=A0ABR4DP37_9PEZI